MDERRQRALGGLLERWQDVQVVYKLLFDPLVPFIHKLIPIVALIYLISPIDLIPDVLIGLGQADDLAIILFALGLFLRVAPPERVAAARGLPYEPPFPPEEL